jgi:hypothetical protein
MTATVAPVISHTLVAKDRLPAISSAPVQLPFQVGILAPRAFDRRLREMIQEAAGVPSA